MLHTKKVLHKHWPSSSSNDRHYQLLTIIADLYIPVKNQICINIIISEVFLLRSGLSLIGYGSRFSYQDRTQYTESLKMLAAERT